VPTGRDPSFRWGDENMKAVGPFGLAAFFFFITPDSFRVHGVTENSRWMGWMPEQARHEEWAG